MNDERFNHDLLQVLREAAGEEAPMSLRSRISRITDEAPVSRRLWFSPPMRLSLAVVSVVALLALSVLLLPRDNVGPGPSQSPEPTPSMEQSATPAPSAEPTPTLEPTPAPTPELASWSGLAWDSIGMPGDEQSFSWITDIVAAKTGYVGVGGIYHLETGAVDLAFFSGVDWGDRRAWVVMYQVPGAAGDFAALAGHLVRTDGGFLAVIAPQDGSREAPTLWSSPDGASWSEVDEIGWREGWTNASFVGIAAGTDGVVAVGADRTTGQVIVLDSRDGSSWTAASWPVAEAVVIPRDVAAVPDGFVIVGREGQPDAYSADTGLVTPGVGRPAAWTSRDGMAWTSVPVEGNVAAGAELRRVFVGADGLLATGVNTPTGETRPGVESPNGNAAWISRDGRSWQPFDELWKVVVDVRQIASDGARIVIFGVDESTADEYSQADSAAWVAFDARTWTRLSDANGDAPRFPTRQAASECAGCPAPSGLWVVNDGIFVSIGGGAPSQGMLMGLAR